MKRAILTALFPIRAASSEAGAIALGGFKPGKIRAVRRPGTYFGVDAHADTHELAHSLYRDVLKRVFDMAIVVLAAPVVVPIVLVLALLVACEGGRPFYDQLRVGKDGRAFRMWKLRTMVVDADDRMTDYLAINYAAKLEWDRDQKLRFDPRITPLGQFLRKTSLDELPQLWNVLCGDMSIVGPRPMMLNQEKLYPGNRYYMVRPGLTGLWQTTDRNHTSFAGRADFDTVYVDTLSFAADVRIILKTVQVVALGTGY